ncbi:MAG: restriction endonuclease subunit S, partial [Deltaproteobacteria bacterium]|nr:restriction endonuclease subunit S [Deltaproteobacteria bacterium]
MRNEVPFRNIAQLVRDIVQPDEVDDMPYIGLEHIEQNTLRLNGWGYSSDVNSPKFRFRKGDILFGKLRPYFRKVIRAPFDGICSTDIWVVRAKKGLDQGYLYYWMASQDFVDFASTGSEGTRMPRAKWEHVGRFSRPYIPLPEQRAIARILGTLDDKIELNRRMNETLEAIARAIFKSWFVDFDPVIDNALAAGKPIPEEFAERAARRAQLVHGKSSLPENIRRIFPDEFQDSELGPIPKGWEVGQLGDLVGFLSGYAFRSRDWRDKGIPVVKIGSIKPGIIDLDTVSYVSEQVATQASRYRLSPADLLVGMTGYVGEVGLVPPTDNLPLLNQRVGKFVPEKNGTESLGFVYCLTRRPQFKAEVEAKSHGTAQANVSAKGILSIVVILPPRPLRELFNRICKPVFDRILNDWAKSHILTALRDTLLPR